MESAYNFFGIDWEKMFNLEDLPINSYFNKVDGNSGNTERLKNEVKNQFPEVSFCEGLGKFKKLTPSSS